MNDVQDTTPASAASGQEVMAALKALTVADWIRLEKFAASRIRCVGKAGYGLKPDDLIHDAVVAFLDGTRHWNKSQEVSFRQVLIGAILSISSNIAKGRKPNVDVDSVTIAGLSVENPEINALAVEREQRNGALVEEIYNLFANDEQAQLVLLGWTEGYAGSEMRQNLELTETAYNTICRRIRRKVDASGLYEVWNA